MLTYSEDILRRRLVIDASTTADWQFYVRLIATLCAYGCLYGAVMGTFSATSTERLLQVFYAAVKVPALLIATFLISTPSFFVLNTLLGLRNDFRRAVGAIIMAQAGLAIVLASLAPLTLFWYASFPGYHAAIRFNAVMFGVASFSAQVLIYNYYRPLIDRNPKHRWMMWCWVGIYAFVGIQMGWVMRPFVGSAQAPVQFFRPEAWDNAYVVVARIFWKSFTQ